MPKKTAILDGLWYCLRPSLISPSPTRSFLTRKSSNYHNRTPVPTASVSFPPAKPHPKLATTEENRISGPDAIGSNPADELLDQQDTPRYDDHQTHPDDVPPIHLRPPRRRHGPKTLESYKRMMVSRLEDKPIDFLEAKLEIVATKSPNVRIAMTILHVLIGQRHIRAEVRHYRALILANCDPKFGSADQVRALLAEMEPNGIPLDSATLHAALQALAVHPDYILRENIMQTLRDRWLSLSPDGWHWVVAGLVRQQQFELALDHIAQMHIKSIPVKNWLHSMIIYNLCEIEDFDEVLRQMDSRLQQGHDMTLDLWFYVLDVSSAALHRKMTRYAWRRMVVLGYLQPPYGTCSNVLTVAGREGDYKLAGSVFRYFEEMGIQPGLADYEKLAEAHLVSGDLSSAFEVLCTMHKSGIALEASSTRPFLTFMITTGTTPRKAWDVLKQLRSQKYDIPVSCANVVIELSENKALYDARAVDQAVAFYKELYSLCPGGADVQTYNSLINMCRRAHKSDAAMFILKEMSALNVMPSDQTFEYIILMCLNSENFRSAYFYLQDFIERGGYLSKETAIQIQRICSASRGEFATALRNHPLLREYAERNRDHGREKSKRAVPQKPIFRTVISDGPRRVRRSLSPRAVQARHNVRRARRRLVMSRETRNVANKERRRRKRRFAAVERVAKKASEESAGPTGSTGSTDSSDSTSSSDQR